MRDLKANKGITLIALVVTIIVLLILAAVTINLVLGQNGIIGKANQAKTITPQKEAEEAIKLVLGEWQIEKYTGTMNLKEFLESKVPNELDSVIGEEAPFEVEKNGYVFKVKDDGTIELQRQIDPKYIPTITSKITTDAEGTQEVVENVESGTPLYIVLTINLQEGTVKNVTSAENLDSVGTSGKYIYKVTKNGTYKFSITTNEGTDNEYTTTNTVEVEKIKIANVPGNWINTTKTAWGYSYKDMSSSNQTEVAVNEPSLTSEMTPIKYVAGSTTGLEEGSKWANAMTPDGSMWVWIPRYAYKITNGEHGEGLTYSSDNITTEAGTIDIIFLKDKTNKDFNGNDIPSGYIVHPAFTSNANAGGGFGSQSGEDDGIEGIWVAKFEASSVEGNSNSTADNVTTKTLQVKPNVSSWRNIQIGNMYTVARNAVYGTTQTKSSLHSHIMKNSEWGTTAYLAHSKYGRNGTEISINNTQTTGKSAGKPGNSTIESSTSYVYNTTQGVLASTTGNVYGIYDMSGGAWEYVASYVNNGNSHLDNGSSFTTKNTTTATSNEYVTVYSKGTSGDSQLGNYEASSGMKGDAVYETSKTSGSYNQTSWFSDYSSLPYSDGPFFSRGGGYGARAGAFYFSDDAGSNDSYDGFRPVLVVF